MASALFSTDATAKRVSMPVGTQPAQPGLAKTGLPTAAADPAALDAQRAEAYAAQKERAQQQGNAAKTQNNEALKRRFAAIGNLNSGAFVKAAGQADQVSDANTQAAVKISRWLRTTRNTRRTKPRRAASLIESSLIKTRLLSK